MWVVSIMVMTSKNGLQPELSNPSLSVNSSHSLIFEICHVNFWKIYFPLAAFCYHMAEKTISLNLVTHSENCTFQLTVGSCSKLHQKLDKCLKWMSPTVARNCDEIITEPYDQLSNFVITRSVPSGWYYSIAHCSKICCCVAKCTFQDSLHFAFSITMMMKAHNWWAIDEFFIFFLFPQ